LHARPAAQPAATGARRGRSPREAGGDWWPDAEPPGLAGRLRLRAALHVRAAALHTGHAAAGTHPRRPGSAMHPLAGNRGLIEVENLRVTYAVRGGWLRPRAVTVVHDVSLTLARGEALGLVGE